MSTPRSGAAAIAKRVVHKFVHRDKKLSEKTHEDKHQDIPAAKKPQGKKGQDNPAAKKKRKKWGVTDPAEISPHYYHHDLFKASFPLVNIVRVPAGVPFPVRDKFDGHALDEKLMVEANRVWRKRAVHVSRRFKPPQSEQQAFPFHLALIEEMKQFTMPSPRDIERLSECSSRKRKIDFDGEGNPSDVEQCVGFDIKSVCDEDMQVLGGSGSKNKGLDIVPEGSANLEDDLREHEDIPTGFADSVLFVHDGRALNKRQRTEDFVPDAERVCGILERKFAEDRSKERAKWQGGFYGCKYAMVNLSKGHGTPLYVIEMTSSTWSYGQVVPEGYVQIRDGKVDPASWKTFLQHQELTGKGTYKDLASLDIKLAEGTQFYRNSYADNRQAVYRDGPMLVGTYYVRDAWYPLPTTVSHGFNHAGAHRLLSGLLRLVLGDYAMTMSKQELQKRIHLNEEIDEELIEDVY